MPAAFGRGRLLYYTSSTHRLENHSVLVESLPAEFQPRTAADVSDGHRQVERVERNAIDEPAQRVFPAAAAHQAGFHQPRADPIDRKIRMSWLDATRSTAIQSHPETGSRPASADPDHGRHLHAASQLRERLLPRRPATLGFHVSVVRCQEDGETSVEERVEQTRQRSALYPQLELIVHPHASERHAKHDPIHGVDHGFGVSGYR